MKIKVTVKEPKTVKEKINTPFIKLDSFLKMCGAVDTGGQAKMFILDGEVKVNGETCLQRGKKLRPGDNVRFRDIKYEIE